MNDNQITSAQRLTFGSAGFVVLDIVELDRDSPPIHLYLGGTAGNVAVILGALGWQSYPFARLPQHNPGFPILAEDLNRFGVRADFVSLTPSAPLPALVQRKRADGGDEPLFTFRCPRCSSRWRGWSAITQKTAKAVADRLPRFHVFFIDRYTRGNLALASQAKAAGALVFFEPASLNISDRAEVSRFKEALEIADVLKYSAQQFSELNDDDFPRQPTLEIHTRGKDGLRFRRRLPEQTMSSWIEIAVSKAHNVVDTCGAGDWLTAVLIHLIGRQQVTELSDQRLRETVAAAQAASAWACGFAGARGGMYDNDPLSLEDFVVEQTGQRYSLSLPATGPPASRSTTLKDAMLEFCPMCRGDWLRPAAPQGEFGTWRDIGRPGYVGRRAASKQAALTKEYGPGNWRIAYKWHGKAISREQALGIYVDAYEAHLLKNPKTLDWLVRTARDVYDISPTDVESGTDFTIQKQSATHLQDIAVRITLKRLGRRFEGTELIQIRGKDSAGSELSPGVVAFHEPDAIEKPELRGWWKPGSIESFWQSNKCLEVRQWQSRIFVFGGSFNPIHNGHLALARFARDHWGFDRVIFVPNGDNYRKKTLAGTPAQVRLEMVQAAIDGEAGMEVLDVEVYDAMAVRTPITMRELSEQNPDSQLALFRGFDSLHRVHRDCFSLPNLIVLALARKGFNLSLEQVLARYPKFEHVRDRILYVGDAIVDDVSSTQVREAVSGGLSIGVLVPVSVEQIIKHRGLYSNG